MQINHKEAHQLIHLALDGNLDARQKQHLDAHLRSCSACQQYRDGIKNMESVLYPMLKRQWNQQPIPLSMSLLASGHSSRSTNSTLLATRIAAISVMFMIFMFSAWQFTMSNTAIPNPAQANIPSMPIPSTSTQWTGTTTELASCSRSSYTVKKDDTLASIAYRYSVSQEDIILSNDLKSSNVITGQELVIPICSFTPTGTVKPLTTTFTPNLNRITSTPGG